MVDNVSITPGVGLTVAADDIGGGVLAQRVKPVFGVDGTGVDVSASNPLPVTDAAAAASLASIATAVASTTPSPVELGPFSSIYLTSGSNAAVQNTTAAVGDYLQHAILQPTTTSPGAFTLYDGSSAGTNSIKYTHPGGASSLSNLAPIIVGFSSKCVNAGWHITIVSGWTVTLVGTFT